MSRLAKKPIPIPAGVATEFRDGVFGVKGPKGELKRSIPRNLALEISGSEITIRPVSEGRRGRIFSGTYASHVKNMLDGVSKGFEKKLEIEGVGFRAELKGSSLSLNVGLSHPVVVPPRAGISFKVEKNAITVSGADKEAVGDEAARIRRVREPEPYKGTGIRYAGEVIRRKSGKKVVASAV
ncbi:MAG: 50S ribosomal protein L6 [Candidatus Niyogibacteria bacterium]|nr:50S ribosomal protein L6 [Candidatus Niyogibacteria bacterium]